VLVLFDEKVDEIILSLPENSRARARQLTYEGLFCSPDGRNLAKELVKAIVNRNIANGSNVDTVAEALRRRCGSFCSADDVVIFKAQEQVKRASEAGPTSEASRRLLNESLRLFQKVAGSLSMEHLEWAVSQYIPMSFYAGAIQLALTVAHESDRANRALSWLRDDCPEDVRSL
jgi:nuclear pore complex protein Nup155